MPDYQPPTPLLKNTTAASDRMSPSGASVPNARPGFADTQWRERLKDADRCVMCGMCIPSCPTFSVHGVEARSPRGRLVAMTALRDGRLAPDALHLAEHLGSCTGCGTCEALCPADVPFTRLLDAARIPTIAAAPLSRPLRLLRFVLVRPPLARLLAGPGRLVSHILAPPRGAASGSTRRRWLQRLPTGMSRVLLRTAPTLTHTAHRETTSTAAFRRPPGARAQIGTARRQPTRDVRLLAGCLEPYFQAPTLAALERIAAHAGVRLIRERGCCGALHQHAGDPTTGGKLAAARIAATEGIDAVALDTGCLAQLREHGSGAMSVSAWIASLELPRSAWREDPVTVRLHRPCSERNALREPHATQELLAALPGVRVLRCDSEPACCGAGGWQWLSAPDQADQLARQTLAALVATAKDERVDPPADSPPHLVVSANLGCRLHLQGCALDPEFADSPGRARADAMASPRPDQLRFVSVAEFVAERLRAANHPG